VTLEHEPEPLPAKSAALHLPHPRLVLEGVEPVRESGQFRLDPGGKAAESRKFDVATELFAEPADFLLGVVEGRAGEGRPVDVDHLRVQTLGLRPVEAEDLNVTGHDSTPRPDRTDTALELTSRATPFACRRCALSGTSPFEASRGGGQYWTSSTSWPSGSRK
jgi:hypothetical protein